MDTLRLCHTARPSDSARLRIFVTAGSGHAAALEQRVLVLTVSLMHPRMLVVLRGVTTTSSVIALLTAPHSMGLRFITITIRSSRPTIAVPEPVMGAVSQDMRDSFLRHGISPWDGVDYRGISFENTTLNAPQSAPAQRSSTLSGNMQGSSGWTCGCECANGGAYGSRDSVAGRGRDSEPLRAVPAARCEQSLQALDPECKGSGIHAGGGATSAGYELGGGRVTVNCWSNHYVGVGAASMGHECGGGERMSPRQAQCPCSRTLKAETHERCRQRYTGNDEQKYGSRERKYRSSAPQAINIPSKRKPKSNANDQAKKNKPSPATNSKSRRRISMG